jgi:DNA-binding NarL/FixJ family response regulator
MSPYGVLVAHGHALFRDGLRELLQKIPDVKVVGEVGDGRELKEALNRLTPDLVIIDLRTPAIEGPKAIEQIKKDHPETKILILSANREPTYFALAFKKGADGYLLDVAPSSELVKAVETVRLGNLYLCPILTEDTSKKWVREIMEGKKSRNGRPPLTQLRQLILQWIAEGRTSGEIAGFLGTSERTIEHHRFFIKKKLELKSTADLVRYAVEKGIV